MGAPLHIGIAGCSAEGAALCYRTLVAMGNRKLGGHAHPPISMHTPSLQAYVDCLDRGDVQGVAGLMLESAQRLQAAGADFLICPDNTIHQAMHLVRPASPLPWLHIAEVVADEAAARGFRRLGLTGTAWLVKSDVYPQALAARGIHCIQPADEAREQMGRLIMDELVHGVFREDTTRWFQSVVESFRAQGCDAVVLGCTEIPLILGDHNSALPTLDSTRLLAAAALSRALAG
ncbi:aspartate/glutamate racemase family protein [Ramlibacter humi]|uniref:Amino acid racemase n=1 Tax=Ramlibacter humi TaxID=2530451 RepID=A0A4Z0CB02_9BURK|nr:amino acid racemase [Ramlibacter humi]TFZ07598.1 amino acid racemase [Ramlibacter humi]